MIMELNKIPKKYRPVPFWSWNDKLNVKEISDQVRMMERVGIGGFFMHARGGLSTEYMGEEWFENISSAVQTSAECGMGTWVYDENGWPSGFGNGFVNGLGVRYQQKYLRMTDHEPEANVIGKSGSHWFYYDVNPFYVDTLDRDVVAKFGKQSYSCILCEHCEVLFENTRKLLDKFVKSGGKVVTVDDLIADAIVDNTRITYTRRSFENYRVHYFGNSSPNYEKAKFQVNGKILDIFTGELKAFSGKHEFEPWGK